LVALPVVIVDGLQHRCQFAGHRSSRPTGQAPRRDNQTFGTCSPEVKHRSTISDIVSRLLNARSFSELHKSSGSFSCIGTKAPSKSAAVVALRRRLRGVDSLSAAPLLPSSEVSLPESAP
jgi:hypothetical protein